MLQRGRAAWRVAPGGSSPPDGGSQVSDCNASTARESSARVKSGRCWCDPSSGHKPRRMPKETTGSSPTPSVDCGGRAQLGGSASLSSSSPRIVWIEVEADETPGCDPGESRCKPGRSTSGECALDYMLPQPEAVSSTLTGPARAVAQRKERRTSAQLVASQLSEAAGPSAGECSAGLLWIVVQA